MEFLIEYGLFLAKTLTLLAAIAVVIVVVCLFHFATDRAPKSM